jgi:hypothetical protein
MQTGYLLLFLMAISLQETKKLCIIDKIIAPGLVWCGANAGRAVIR